MAEETTLPNVTVEGEGNLPDVVASLEMLSVSSASSQPDTSIPRKMVLRKRIRKAENTEVRNRRCSLRPKKRTNAEMENEDDVKEYYLDKNVRRKAINLETIFEEPSGHIIDGVLISMSSKRFKRMIQFNNQPTEAKIKKRRAKVKKIFGPRFLTKHRRQTSMQTLINKLNVTNAESLMRIAEDTCQINRTLNPFDAVRPCSVRQ